MAETAAAVAPAAAVVTVAPAGATSPVSPAPSVSAQVQAEPTPAPPVVPPAPVAAPKHDAFVPEMPRHLTSAAPSQRVIGTGTAGDGRAELLELGWERLVETKTQLARALDVLPELEEPPQPKPLRKQPAFIVSVVVAGATLLGVGAMFVVGVVFRAPDRVVDLVIQDAGDNYLIQWSGPDVPYSVVMTDDALEHPADLEAMINGRQAWLPKRGLGVTSDSCFIVRSLDAATTDVFSEDADAIAAQGGERVCVLDAVDR